MSNIYFLQMSGLPGSGKSTLARSVAKITEAIIIDHDIVKSAFLETMGLHNSKEAGNVSYNIEWALIEFYLSQGRSVILDSPCLYSEIIDKGTYLSQKYNVKYKFIECYLDNLEEINHRLKVRVSMKSQIKRFESEEKFKSSLEKLKRPDGYSYLVVDTSMPLLTYFKNVIEYIQS